MKTVALFLLLVGVLTASANTLTDENLLGDNEDEEIEQRELAGNLDDDDVDLENLLSEKEERSLAGDLEEDGADLERSAMEERALTEDVADAHPVDVSRRFLKCGRKKCQICLWASKSLLCIGGKLGNGNVIIIYISKWGKDVWTLKITVKKNYTLGDGNLKLYITGINLHTRSFCLQLVYKKTTKVKKTTGWWRRRKTYYYLKTTHLKFPRSPYCRSL